MKKRFTVKASSNMTSRKRIAAATSGPYKVTLDMSEWEFEKWCEQLCDEIIEAYDHTDDLNTVFDSAVDGELTYYDDRLGIIHGARYYEWDDSEIRSTYDMAYNAIRDKFYESGLWDRLEEAWESGDSYEEEE